MQYSQNTLHAFEEHQLGEPAAAGSAPPPLPSDRGVSVIIYQRGSTTSGSIVIGPLSRAASRGIGRPRPDDFSITATVEF